MKTGNVIIGGTTYTATHTYRFGDKLTGIASAIPGETASVAYNYDGLGKRRFRNANGQYTWWRWDLGWNAVTQYADTNTDWTIAGFNKMFVPYGHSALAEADVASGGTPANATYSYLAQDHLGTGRFVYNQAKTQTAAFEHYPYGARYTASGAAPYHEFTGKPWDPDSNLYYFPYRYLRPDMARWTSADPLGLVDGPNVYGYATDSPVIYFDYLGMTTCKEKAYIEFYSCNRDVYAMFEKMIGAADYAFQKAKRYLDNKLKEDILFCKRHFAAGWVREKCILIMEASIGTLKLDAHAAYDAATLTAAAYLSGGLIGCNSNLHDDLRKCEEECQ